MRWCFFGCSHSSKTWGTPWNHYLGEALGAPSLIDGSSQGGSNEYALIKLLTSFSLKPELVVWQRTENARLTLGIDGYVAAPVVPFRWEGDTVFDDAFYYTFNVMYNESNLKALLSDETAGVDNFFIKHTILSKFNCYIKPLQSLLLAQLACKAAGIKLLVFDWWEQPPLYSKVTLELATLINWSMVLDRPVWQYLQKTRGERWINEHDAGGLHLDSEAHKIIADELIIPFVKSHI